MAHQTQEQIVARLNIYWPNTVWNLRGHKYSDLEWLDSSPKPTKEELFISDCHCGE